MARAMAEIIQNMQKDNYKKLNKFMTFTNDSLKQLESTANVTGATATATAEETVMAVDVTTCHANNTPISNNYTSSPRC